MIRGFPPTPMFRTVLNQPRLLFPIYWPAWVGYGLLCIVVALPHRARLGFGRWLGRLVFKLAKSRRHIVRSNLAVCFPNLDESEREKLVHEIFESGGISIVETAISWIGGEGSVQDQVEIEGLDHLRQAQEEGRGVILLGSHMSTLDLAGALLAKAIPFVVMYRKNPNLLIDLIMLRGRQRHFPEAIERNDIKGVIRSLKQGQIVWYGPDQDYGIRNSVFTPFFDVPAATMTAVSRLAKMTGARVVPFSHFRLDGGTSYRIVLDPPWDDFPGETFEADALRINQHVEKVVVQAPEQYWWFHRRFKSRRPEEPSVY